MKGGKNEMFTIFKKALSFDAKNKGKEDMLKHMRSSKVSGMTHIRLDVLKKTFYKSLGCARSMRKVCTRCEESST